MKKLIILSLAVFGLIISSCKKTPEEILAQASMTAKVDGAAWTSTVRTATIKSVNLSINDTTEVNGPEGLYITGTTLSGSNIIISTQQAVKGVYELNILAAKTQCTVLYYPNPINKPSEVYTSLIGKVEITEITSEHVSGTFSFTVSDLTGKTIEITEGEFTNLKL